MPTLKACALDSAFRKLTHLNLSMNKIAVVEGGFECSNLYSLILTDNLIKEIPPRLLAKCPKLQLLDLSLNHISRIQNLPTTLTELSLAQNRLTVIEGLS
jgi:Leucine-rich repeat (LRR) protein